MKKMKEIYIDNGDMNYRYAVTKVANVRDIHLEKYEIYEKEEHVEKIKIVIAKVAGWYYMAFPQMGTASPGFSNLGNYGLVSDLVCDAGYWNPDVEAITLAIMDLAKSGF